MPTSLISGGKQVVRGKFQPDRRFRKTGVDLTDGSMGDAERREELMHLVSDNDLSRGRLAENVQ